MVSYAEDMWSVAKRICGRLRRGYVVGCAEDMWSVVQRICGRLCRGYVVGCAEDMWWVGGIGNKTNLKVLWT